MQSILVLNIRRSSWCWITEWCFIFIGFIRLWA